MNTTETKTTERPATVTAQSWTVVDALPDSETGSFDKLWKVYKQGKADGWTFAVDCVEGGTGVE